jgi:flagellin
MYINTNIVSLNAQANLANSQSTLATDIQRLSSGLRINSAADDAAGMAIATRMGSQISGQNQAIRNANDGISLSQTAQGAMQSIVANLQTMRSLAVQASNATYSASDRASMNAEVLQLKSEIDRVAASTQFNGVNLLDGTFTAKNFQVGANNTSNDVIQVASIANMQTTSLQSDSSAVAGTSTTAALNAGDLTLNGYQVGASQVFGAPGQTADSAFSIAQAIDGISSQSGVNAIANATTLTGTGPTSFTAVAANTFSINGFNVGAIAAGGNAAGQGANAAAAINLISAQTGVTASADAVTGALTLTASDGRNINVGMNGTTTTLSSAYTGVTALGAQLGLSATQIGTQALSANAGTVDTASNNVAAAGGGTVVSSAVATTTSTISAGSLFANGIDVGAIQLAASTAAVASTSSLAATTGSFTVASGQMGTVTDLTATIGGTTKTIGSVALTGNANIDAATLAAAINSQFSGAVNVSNATITNASGANTISFGLTTATNLSAAQATANVNQLTSLTGLASTYFGKQAYGGLGGNANAVATAINTALANATGGAAVNGTATANTTTGIVTVSGGTSAAVLTMASGEAASTLSATGFSTAQLGYQTTAAGAPQATAGTIAAGSFLANGQSVGAITLNASVAATAATSSVANGGTFTVAAGSAQNLSDLTVQLGSGTAQALGNIHLTGTAATDAVTIAAAINTALGLTGSSQVWANGSTGVITNSSGQALTFGLAGVSQNSTTAASDLTQASTVLGLGNSYFGTRASGGAVGNGIAIAAAISTALAAATGGAAVNGQAVANATTGVVSVISGTSQTALTMPTTLNAAQLMAAQGALSAQSGFSTAQLGGNAASAALAAATRGTVSLTSTSASGINIGGNAAASAGFTVGATVATATSAVSSVDVTTQTNASNAISAIDGAINMVNTAMGLMGAVQNRFQSVVTNLQTGVQNLTAAQSRIQDTDFAATTASLTQAQILQQAGTAMLAQANAMPNAVLTLLK